MKYPGTQEELDGVEPKDVESLEEVVDEIEEETEELLKDTETLPDSTTEMPKESGAEEKDRQEQEERAEESSMSPMDTNGSVESQDMNAAVVEAVHGIVESWEKAMGETLELEELSVSGETRKMTENDVLVIDVRVERRDEGKNEVENGDEEELETLLKLDCKGVFKAFLKMESADEPNESEVVNKIDEREAPSSSEADAPEGNSPQQAESNVHNLQRQGSFRALPPAQVRPATIVDPGVSNFRGTNALEFESYLKYFEEYAAQFMGAPSTQWAQMLLNKVDKRVQNAIKEGVQWHTSYPEVVRTIRRAIKFMNEEEWHISDGWKDPLVTFTNTVRRDGEAIDSYGVRLVERFLKAFPHDDPNNSELLRTKLLSSLNKRDAYEIKINMASSGKVAFERLVRLANMVENKNRGYVRQNERYQGVYRQGQKRENEGNVEDEEMCEQMEYLCGELHKMKVDNEARRMGENNSATEAAAGIQDKHKKQVYLCQYCGCVGHSQPFCFKKLRHEGRPIIRCAHCDKYGHLERDCRRKIAEERRLKEEDD